MGVGVEGALILCDIVTLKHPSCCEQAGLPEADSEWRGTGGPALHYRLLGVFVFYAQLACTVNTHLGYYLTVK